MAHLSTPALRPLPKVNHWPVRVVSLLLIVQSFGLATIAIYFLRSINWADEVTYLIVSVHVQDTALSILLFAGVAAILLLTAILLYLRWAGAWLMAMGLQGFALSYCLTIYFFTNAHLRASLFLYLIMLSSIVLVLYLNTTDVRHALVKGASSDPWQNEDFRRSETPDPPPPLELTDERRGE